MRQRGVVHGISYHSHTLLRQMAAQKKQKKTRDKMKNIHKYRRKIKRKTMKSKSEYASKARPNNKRL